MRPTFHEWYSAVRQMEQPDVIVQMNPSSKYVKENSVNKNSGAFSKAQMHEYYGVVPWLPDSDMSVYTEETEVAEDLEGKGLGRTVSNAAANIAAIPFGSGTKYIREAEQGNAAWLASQGYRTYEGDIPEQVEFYFDDENFRIKPKDEDAELWVYKEATVPSVSDIMQSLANPDFSTVIRVYDQESPDEAKFIIPSFGMTDSEGNRIQGKFQFRKKEKTDEAD